MADSMLVRKPIIMQIFVYRFQILKLRKNKIVGSVNVDQLYCCTLF